MKKNKFENKSLYFVAITPDEPIRSEIIKLKNWMHTEFRSKAALRSPPHITLHMPFKWKAEKEKLLQKSLSQLANSITPFEVTVHKYGCFEPRVIYLDVLESRPLKEAKERVMELSRKVWKLNLPRDMRGFHPHITLAFRDLKKPQFYMAWEKVKNKHFNSIFEANSLVLLKHNGKSWDEFQRFKFG